MENVVGNPWGEIGSNVGLVGPNVDQGAFASVGTRQGKVWPHCGSVGFLVDMHAFVEPERARVVLGW